MDLGFSGVHTRTSIRLTPLQGEGKSAWPKVVATLLTEKADPNAMVRDMSMREGRGGEVVLSLQCAPCCAGA